MKHDPNGPPFVWLREERGGPTKAQRDAEVEAWHRREAKRRLRALGCRDADPPCAICGEPVEGWKIRRPAKLSTCFRCDGPVPMNYPHTKVSGIPPGYPSGVSSDLSGILRACTVALWHLEHLEGVKWRHS